MKIIILTSSDHIYANYVITNLIRGNLFKSHKVTVLEQDSIIPKKSKWSGLFRYMNISGWNYVLNQIIKQELFKLFSYKADITNDSKSTYYPYSKFNLSNISIKKLNNLRQESNLKYLTKLKPDLILSIYSKEIIPDYVINLPKFGCINLHPAPLPNYKGVSPIFWALANKENIFGSTLHYINSGIDTGPIIYRNKFKHATPATEHEVYLKCATLGIQQLTSFLLKKSLVSVNTIPNSKNGNYNSLPTKKAVKQFFSLGNKFFTFSEFL